MYFGNLGFTPDPRSETAAGRRQFFHVASMGCHGLPIAMLSHSSNWLPMLEVVDATPLRTDIEANIDRNSLEEFPITSPNHKATHVVC